MINRRHARRIALLAALAMVVVVIVAARRYRADDAPYAPTDDREVLERITAGPDPRDNELRELERALARAPSDLALAERVARQHVAAARRSGDTRRLSYADAALAPFLARRPPPPQALFLRAVVRQAHHDFEGALADLDAAIASAPTEEARRTRAAVLTVLGRYEEARRDCESPVQLSRVPPDPLCRAPIDAITGHADAARTALAAFAAAPQRPRTELAQARSRLGEAALYAGDLAEAERSLRGTLDLDSDDAYSRALLADVLLDADKAAAVLDLIGTDEVNDVLLLRRAIAARRLGRGEASVISAALRARAEEAVARGDRSQPREVARRLLELDDDAPAALKAAADGFARQREPRDARVLLEAAARVAREPARSAEALKAAAPALAWLRASGCTWPPLRRAADTLEPTR